MPKGKMKRVTKAKTPQQRLLDWVEQLKLDRDLAKTLRGGVMNLSNKQARGMLALLKRQPAK